MQIFINAEYSVGLHEYICLFKQPNVKLLLDIFQIFLTRIY